MQDEDGERPAHKASADDEFLKHPCSGAFIRNPLQEKGRVAPIHFSVQEYEYNGLDNALCEWTVVHVSEASLKNLVELQSGSRRGSSVGSMPRGSIRSPPTALSLAGAQTVLGGSSQAAAPVARSETRSSRLVSSSSRGLRSTGSPSVVLRKQRAALGRLRDMPHDFDICLKKSLYVPPKREARPPKRKKDEPPAGVWVEKLNCELSDEGPQGLCLQTIQDGLVLQWNRANPSFALRVGDRFTSVNGHAVGAVMLDELATCADALRISVHRRVAASAAGSPPGTPSAGAASGTPK